MATSLRGEFVTLDLQPIPAVIPVGRLKEFFPRGLSGLKMRNPAASSSRPQPYMPKYTDTSRLFLDLRPAANGGCSEFFFPPPSAASSASASSLPRAAVNNNYSSQNNSTAAVDAPAPASIATQPTNVFVSSSANALAMESGGDDDDDDDRQARLDEQREIEARARTMQQHQAAATAHGNRSRHHHVAAARAAVSPTGAESEADVDAELRERRESSHRADSLSQQRQHQHLEPMQQTQFAGFSFAADESDDDDGQHHQHHHRRGQRQPDGDGPSQPEILVTMVADKAKSALTAAAEYVAARIPRRDNDDVDQDGSRGSSDALARIKRGAEQARDHVSFAARSAVVALTEPFAEEEQKRRRRSHRRGEEGQQQQREPTLMDRLRDGALALHDELKTDLQMQEAAEAKRRVHQQAQQQQQQQQERHHQHQPSSASSRSDTLAFLRNRQAAQQQSQQSQQLQVYVDPEDGGSILDRRQHHHHHHHRSDAPATAPAPAPAFSQPRADHNDDVASHEHSHEHHHRHHRLHFDDHRGDGGGKHGAAAAPHKKSQQGDHQHQHHHRRHHDRRGSVPLDPSVEARSHEFEGAISAIDASNNDTFASGNASLGARPAAAAATGGSSNNTNPLSQLGSTATAGDKKSGGKRSSKPNTKEPAAPSASTTAKSKKSKKAKSATVSSVEPTAAAAAATSKADQSKKGGKEDDTNRKRKRRRRRTAPDSASSSSTVLSSSSSSSDSDAGLTDRERKWNSDRADALRLLLAGLVLLLGIGVASIERDNWMRCGSRTLTRALRGNAVAGAPSLISDDSTAGSTATHVYLSASAGIWSSCITAALNITEEGNPLAGFEVNLVHALKTVREGRNRREDSALLTQESSEDWELSATPTVMRAIDRERALPVFQVCRKDVRDHKECHAAVPITFTRFRVLALMPLIVAAVLFISVILDLNVLRSCTVKIHKVVLALSVTFIWSMSLSVWLLYVDSANVPSVAGSTHAECELESNLREVLASFAAATLTVAYNSSVYSNMLTVRTSQGRADWNATETAQLALMRGNLSTVPVEWLTTRVVYFDDCDIGFSLWGMLSGWLLFTVCLVVYTLSRISSYRSYAAGADSEGGSPFNPMNLFRAVGSYAFPALFGGPDDSDDGSSSEDDDDDSYSSSSASSEYSDDDDEKEERGGARGSGTLRSPARRDGGGGGGAHHRKRSSGGAMGGRGAAAGESNVLSQTIGNFLTSTFAGTTAGNMKSPPGARNNGKDHRRRRSDNSRRKYDDDDSESSSSSSSGSSLSSSDDDAFRRGNGTNPRKAHRRNRGGGSSGSQVSGGGGGGSQGESGFGRVLLDLVKKAALQTVLPRVLEMSGAAAETQRAAAARLLKEAFPDVPEALIHAGTKMVMAKAREAILEQAAETAASIAIG